MTGTSDNLWGEIDESGRLILPPDIVKKYGLRPKTRVRLSANNNSLSLHSPAAHLKKVYVEPTNLCNLSCSMCIRHNWDEAMGRMNQETFDRILHDLHHFSPVPTIFFGGLGEPLFHPKTVQWVRQAKETGARVELITNGTMLNERCSRQLVQAGLDLLWVSIDGATPESFSDVRIGAQLDEILANLRRFKQIRKGGHHPSPEIGIAFVAMRRNIHELPEILKIGKQVGASFISVSNVIPYTPEMEAERIYLRTFSDITYINSPWLPKLNLPKLQLEETTKEAFFQSLTSGYSVNFAGNSLSGSTDVCNFIDNGAISFRWDGYASPCWPLMHNHISYLHGKEHRTRRYLIGSINERNLPELWMDSEYVAHREKVQSFDFAPCTFCGGCDLSEANEEDCIGNGFPACGSCLWSQGVIHCP